MYIAEIVYQSLIVFEPWCPAVRTKTNSHGYLSVVWEIPIEEVLDEYPIDGLGHRPRADWMQARVKEVAG
jgi:hypothetical protein